MGWNSSKGEDKHTLFVCNAGTQIESCPNSGGNAK